jgi:hypothetical protein
MEDSFSEALESMEGFSFVAQEAKTPAMPATSVNFAARRENLRIAASINNHISGLHLHATRKAVADDIADRSRRFNR